VSRLTRDALCARWAPGGARLAVGGAESAVSVCAWDAARAMWAPKLVHGRHGGVAVAALAWHPGGELLATVAADGCTCVLSVRPGATFGSA
jgi:hypothetical protein